MTALYPYVTPDGVELLIQWLSPLCEVRDERPTGAVLPYIMVSRIDGPSDGLTEHGVYSVHSFAETLPGAQALATSAHCTLASPWRAQQQIGGIWVDGVTTIEAPTERQYIEDNSIRRFVATYQVDLRICMDDA